MFRAIVIVWLFCSSAIALPQEKKKAQTTQPVVGLDRARELLPEIIRFEIDNSGRFRLKKDHWDKMANAEQNGLAGRGLGGLMGGGGPFSKPFEKLAQRLRCNSRGSGAGLNGAYSEMSASGSEAKMEYTKRSDRFSLVLTESVGKCRLIDLKSSDDATRFLLHWSGGFVFILKSPSGVRVCSGIDGQLESLTGSSFVELVKANKQYFQDTLSPFLNGIATLPVDEALKAVTPDLPQPSFDTVEEEDHPLRDPVVLEALLPLVQLRLVDRQLRFNRAIGDPERFSKELAQARATMKPIVDKAVEGLRSKNATAMQIAEFQRQLRFSDRTFWRAGQVDAIIENQLISDFRTQLSLRAARNAKGGNYNSTIKVNSSHHRVGRFAGRQSNDKMLFVSDLNASLEINVNARGSKVVLQTLSGLMAIHQSLDPEECTLVMIDADGAIMHSQPTYVSLIESLPVDLWQTVKARFAEYMVGGLDPFEEDVVRAVQKQCDGELPDVVDVTKAETAIETVALPLLNDPHYLQALVRRLPDGGRKAIRRRIVRMRRNRATEQEP